VQQQVALPFSEEDQEEHEEEKVYQKDETAFNLLRIVLEMDEALFAMVQHEDAKEELREMFLKQGSRLFSAFCRLGSLLNYPGNRQIALAEAGLYNTSDFLLQLRHFLNDNINLVTPDKGSLQEEVRKQLPYNRMANGLVTHNVPLSGTLDHLPY